MASFLPYFQKYQKYIQKGWPYAAMLAHVLLGSLWVYFSPRSVFAFLLLITSFLSLYYLKTDVRFKL